MAGGAQIAVEAATTNGVIARFAATQAVITGRALTGFAGRTALIAERVIAGGADIRAAVTQRGAATVAGVLVVFVNGIPAIATGCSVPVRQPAVRGSRVVSAEDLHHEQKELSQPTLLQRPGDRMSPFSFAEGVALHMRVRDIIATAGATRIESNDLIGLVTAELIQ